MKNTTSNTEMAMPSAEYLATLAATMNKGPDDALRLWWKTKLLLDQIQAEPSEQVKKKALDLFANNHKLRIDACMLTENVSTLYPLEDAMKAIGVSTKKTLTKLYRSYLEWMDKNCYLTSPIADGDITQTLHSWEKRGMPRCMVDALTVARHEQNVKRGSRNRLNASKRKGRKPVK